MALRVTRQYANVGVQTGGNARVYRQYVEILHEFIFPEEPDVLTPIDITGYPQFEGYRVEVLAYDDLEGLYSRVDLEYDNNTVAYLSVPATTVFSDSLVVMRAMTTATEDDETLRPVVVQTGDTMQDICDYL